MPLTDIQIDNWACNGGLTPYDEQCLNPASIDLRVGKYWRDFEEQGKLITSDAITIYKPSLRVDIHNIIAKFLSIPKWPTAVLAVTYETVDIPSNMCAEVKLKTTPTREGLGHPLADWVDPGYRGKLTLMLHALKTIRLVYMQRICQMVLYELEDNVHTPYGFNGHYMDQNEPTVSWREKYR